MQDCLLGLCGGKGRQCAPLSVDGQHASAYHSWGGAIQNMNSERQQASVSTCLAIRCLTFYLI